MVIFLAKILSASDIAQIVGASPSLQKTDECLINTGEELIGARTLTEAPIGHFGVNRQFGGAKKLVLWHNTAKKLTNNTYAL